MARLTGPQQVIVIGIGCITLLEVIALYKGLNGQIFSAVVGSIAVLVGYMFGRKEKQDAS